jgi:hypothetical protein
MSVACAIAILTSCAADAGEPVVLGPQWFARSLAYYQGFESAVDAPAVNDAGLVADVSARRGADASQAAGPEIAESGFVGRGLTIHDWRAPFALSGAALSPHRPMTLSFWWALTADLPVDGGYTLFELTGKGLVSLFCRGKGEWCALQSPAGVFQVYYFQGIQNVNGIYDFDLLSHLDLRAGAWHHSAVTFRLGRMAEVYTDGQRVFDVSISGRAFAPEDDLTHLAFPGPMVLDEVALLSQAVDGDLLADYFRGMTAIRRYRSE